ncbi:MAG: hypothetical protein HVN35_10345 [Methanobacteriaceae archaeon]|nr:hypothetical protein [Methanobacteriaceae archaeon]
MIVKLNYDNALSAVSSALKVAFASPFSELRIKANKRFNTKFSKWWRKGTGKSWPKYPETS